MVTHTAFVVSAIKHDLFFAFTLRVILWGGMNQKFKQIDATTCSPAYFTASFSTGAFTNVCDTCTGILLPSPVPGPAWTMSGVFLQPRPWPPPAGVTAPGNPLLPESPGPASSRLRGTASCQLGAENKGRSMLTTSQP